MADFYSSVMNSAGKLPWQEIGQNAMSKGFDFGNITQGAISQATDSVAKIGSNASDIAGGLNKIGDAMNKGAEIAEKASKFDKFSKGMGGVAAGVGAAMSVASTINSIVGAVEQQKAAKKQQEMANKQYNLELKKLQQQELNENKLAASIDKSWGGDGKIANTLDYGNHAADGNKSGLNSANQNQGYISSREDSNNANANTESRSSLNTPTLSTQQAIAPAGYSESLSDKDELPDDDENATAS